MNKVCRNCCRDMDDNMIYCSRYQGAINDDSPIQEDEISVDGGKLGITYDDSKSVMDLRDIKKNRKRLGERKKGNKLLNTILNKAIFILFLISIIMVGTYHFLGINRDGIANKFSFLLPKKHTSMDVVYKLKGIRELQTLKINKADFYLYVKEDKYVDLIIRYNVFINFNIEDMKIIENEDGSFILEVKKPQIIPVLLDGVQYTKDKGVDEYPGVEVFDVSNSQAPGPDFTLGEETYRDIAEGYIERQCEFNQELYINKAFDNLNEKLMNISNELGLNISEIKLEGAGQ